MTETELLTLAINELIALITGAEMVHLFLIFSFIGGIGHGSR